MIRLHLTFNSEVTKKGLPKPKNKKKEKLKGRIKKKERNKERKAASSRHSDELNPGPNLQPSHGSGDVLHTMMFYLRMLSFLFQLEKMLEI